MRRRPRTKGLKYADKKNGGEIRSISLSSSLKMNFILLSRELLPFSHLPRREINQATFVFFFFLPEPKTNLDDLTQNVFRQIYGEDEVKNI